MIIWIPNLADTENSNRLLKRDVNNGKGVYYFLMKRPNEKGLVDECCINQCSMKTLTSYCSIVKPKQK
ncbi:hypothetical protein B4U80_13937 [Leptotrombidium deliense]|uniref:Insulin-like domain-containing protein n=1 Tax=Leptotrombidium deliense TaxID=299467 RepID=A0A443S758_9ACAR|nr:hypothetical protein B4U80_13937 [Leptotrombidium deliense]